MFSRKSFSRLSYFPPVWFVDDEDGLLPEEKKPDVIQAGGSCGGAVDKRKERRLKQKQLEQELADEEEIMLIVSAFLKTCAKNSKYSTCTIG